MTVKEFLEEYEIQMNENEQNLLETADHHVLVHGNAGSGKTFLLLARIAYLLKSEQAQPEDMLNLVYNADAARRMAKDYRYRFCDDEMMPTFVDFHSFAYRIVRFHDKKIGKESCKAYRDMEKVAKKLVKEMFALDLHGERLRKLMRQVSYCKNMMLTEADIAKIEVDGINFPAYYKAYEKFKTTRRIYDQDDILVEAARILMSKPEILEVFQNRYRYVHLDETQELSFVSHVILKLLCANTQLFAVADKNQCIGLDYCAFTEALDTFKETYQNAEVYTLEEDYRHNKSIAETANQFMFKGDVEHGLHPLREEECEIKFKGFSDLTRLYEYALRKVIEDEDEIAYLYRDFALAVPLIDTFASNNIPFYFQGNIKKFLADPIVLDLCNFIELFIDPKDMRAFYEIYEKMGLDISNKVLLEITDLLRKDENLDIYQAIMESSYKAAGKKKLSSNMENIRMASTKDSFDMIDFIFDKMGYRARLLKNNITMNNSAILAMKVLADRYRDPATFLSRLRELGEFQCEPVSRINIRSIASSKGFEYSRVCLLDCLASVYPKPCHTDEERENERRLFYMGMCRAVNQLEFFTAKRCHTTRLEISPYIYEIHTQKEAEEAIKAEAAPQPQPKKLKETSIRRGVRIAHATLGEGRVLKVQEGMMSVQFATETKILNIKHCISNKLIDLA